MYQRSAVAVSAKSTPMSNMTILQHEDVQCRR
jgi:hypothetical protein